MEENDNREILKIIDEQLQELAYLEENDLDKFRREYAQDLKELEEKYPNNKKRTRKMVFLAIIVCLLFVVTPVTYYFKGIIFYSAEKKEQFLKANNDIANLKDVQSDYELASNIQYVISEYNKLPFDKSNKGIVIYNNDGIKEVIYVNRIIDANNNYRVIGDCYQTNKDINKSLINCLVKDKKYVVSRIDKAIIEEENFFNNYYHLKEQEI